MDFVHEMKQIQNRMYGEGFGPENPQKQWTRADTWTPTSEVLAKGGDLIIRVELAGVNPEDIEITFMGGMLTISGQRERETGEGEGTSYHVQERYYGAFRRSMSLPENVDDKDISANFRDGVVEILVEGGATARLEPKRIQLNRAIG